MAFMMPVVKNNYEIYPAATKQQQQLSRSRRTSSCRSANGSRPGSRTVSESGKTNVDVILLSPPNRLLNRTVNGGANSTGSMNFYSRSAPASSAFVRPPYQRTVRFIRSVSQDSTCRRRRCDSASATIGSSSSTGSTTSSASNVEATVLTELASSPSKVSGSFSKFHTRLVTKLKRKLGLKDDDVCDDDATVVRSST
ncbi:hypothetical protein CHUAL_001694 [Chamberlinius hualienensis]